MSTLLSCVADFFAGAFLCNCLPHLLAGLQGAPFPSPFARPPGVGDSSPLVNVLWGAFNLLAGLALLAWRPVTIGFHPEFAALAVGFVALGVSMARHFGQVRARK